MIKLSNPIESDESYSLNGWLNLAESYCIYESITHSLHTDTISHCGLLFKMPKLRVKEFNLLR